MDPRSRGRLCPVRGARPVRAEAIVSPWRKWVSGAGVPFGSCRPLSAAIRSRSIGDAYDGGTNIWAWCRGRLSRIRGGARPVGGAVRKGRAHRRGRVRVPARPAGRRRLGRAGERGDEDAVGARHDGALLLNDEGPDGDVPARPRRPPARRLPGACREVLAGVRAGGEEGHHRLPPADAPGGARAGAGAAARSGPAGLGARHPRARDGGTGLGAGNRDGLPRSDVRLPRRRGRATGERQAHRRVPAGRGVRPARLDDMHIGTPAEADRASRS